MLLVDDFGRKRILASPLPGLQLPVVSAYTRAKDGVTTVRCPTLSLSQIRQHNHPAPAGFFCGSHPASLRTQAGSQSVETLQNNQNDRILSNFTKNQCQSSPYLLSKLKETSMPKNKVSDLITDQEMAFARLVLSGTMNDREAAQAVGLSPDTAAYTKSKPRVRAYMLEHRAALQQQLLELQAEELRRLNLDRERVLARLLEIAGLGPEMTRGRIANAQNNQKRSNFIEFYKNRRQSSPEGTAENSPG
jgi:hypothetical protein